VAALLRANLGHLEAWPEVLPWVVGGINMTDHAVLGCSPFEADHGRKPRGLLEGLNTRRRVEGGSLEVRRDRAVGVQRAVRQALEDAAELRRVREDARHARRAPKYRRGQMVLVQGRVLMTAAQRELAGHGRGRYKLAPKYVGPYKVLEATGNNVLLQLPRGLRVTPRVNISRIRPYRGGLNQPPPVLISADGSVYYEPSEVVRHRQLEDGQWRYLVMWAGYGPDHAQWLAPADLELCRELVVEHWRGLGLRPPPGALPAEPVSPT